MYLRTSLLLYCCALGYAVDAQDGYRRSQFGEVSAHAVEQAASRIYGKVRIRWDDRVLLIDPTGQSREITLPGFLQLPIAGGYLFATCIEFAGDMQGGLGRVDDPQAVHVATAAPTLAVFRTTEAGDVTDSRHAALSHGSAPVRCIDVQIRDVRSTAASWPVLEVRYASLHQTDNWSGGIEWHALVDSQSMVPTDQLPTRLWKMTKQGTRVREQLKVTRTSDAGLEIRAVTSGRIIRIKCGASCIVPPEDLLREEW